VQSQDTETEETTWRRLQSIFRKHQEQETGATTPASAPEQAVAENQPGQANPGTVSPSTASNPFRPQEARAGLSDLPRSPAPSSSAPLQRTPESTSGSQPPSQSAITEIRKAVPKPGTAGHSTPRITPQSASQADPPQAVSAEAPTLPTAAQPAAEPAAQPPADLEDQSILTDPSVLTDESVLSDVTGGMSGTDLPGPAIQRLPLESVWPVEAAYSPSAYQPPALRSAPETALPSTPATAEVETVRGALGQVRPGQATDSSIELVATRRPRLPKIPPGAEAQAVQKAPSQAVDAGLERSAMVSAELAGPGMANIETGAWTAPAIQRDVSPGAAAPVEASAEPAHTPAPESVPTPVGPLPADLWKLIGQPVPGQEPEAQPGIEQPTADAGAAAARPDTTISQPAEAQIANHEYPSFQWIQRSAAEEEDETSQASSASERASTAQLPARAENHPAAEPDVDQLAKRVYAEVRRRLQQEWERLRRTP
jgi:hypothetical protein